MSRTRRLETTLGNLIVALTEEATSLLRDPKAAYRWVAYVLADLMRKKRVRLKKSEGWPAAKIMKSAPSLPHS